jgi:hypothetical protein
MTELLLVAFFTAFFLAVLEPLIDLLAIIVSLRFVNATFSLLFSATGNLLSGFTTWQDFTLKAIGCAFLGRALLELVERASYISPFVNSTRQ